MPFPIAAAIGAGASLIGGGINSLQQNNQNKKSRQWSEQMYGRQYQDNINFWNMQNAYNSPQAQMKRYQEAGLNPNLIYGQGNSGNAGSVSTPDVQTPQFKSPELGNAVADGGISFMNAIYDLDIKAAQAKLLETQNTVALEDALLRGSQTRRADFDLDFDKELRTTSADARRESLRQLKVNTDKTINDDARAAAQNSTSIAEAYERMLTLKINREKTGFDISQTEANTKIAYQQLRNLQKDGTLKQLDIELRRLGIGPNDTIYGRVVARIINKLYETYQDGTTIDKKKLRENGTSILMRILTGSL